MGSTVKIRMRDGTGTREYRYLVEDMDRHGNARIYVRRPGRPKVRMWEATGTAAFDAAYRRAFEVADPIPGSIPPPTVGGHAPGTLNSTTLDATCGDQIRLENSDADLRLALSLSFGFGGSNCVLLSSRTAAT